MADFRRCIFVLAALVAVFGAAAAASESTVSLSLTAADTAVSLNIQPVPGDVNGDGNVDCADAAIVRAAFGATGGTVLVIDHLAGDVTDLVGEANDLGELINDQTPGYTLDQGHSSVLLGAQCGRTAGRAPPYVIESIALLRALTALPLIHVRLRSNVPTAFPVDGYDVWMGTPTLVVSTFNHDLNPPTYSGSDNKLGRSYLRWLHLVGNWPQLSVS